MARATIEDVAKQAGVTKSTVSHALSGKRPVAPETRRRIEAAIAQLGYRPNPLAQRLAAGRTGAVGLAYEIVSNRPLGEETAVLATVARVLSTAGFALILLAQPGGEVDEIQRYLESGLLDGVLIGQVRGHDDRVSALCRSGAPFVLLGRTADNNGLSFVDVDIEGAVEMCVEHLAELGHRQVAFLHEDAWSSAAAGRALQAYERACARRRLRLLAPPCPPDPEAVRSSAATLLRQHAELTALIAPTEAAAWSVRQAAGEMGRSVPSDLSVVCLSKSTASALLTPRSTGMDLHQAEQAEQAVALLLELLDQPSPGERQLLLEPEWVSGETTAPA